MFEWKFQKPITIQTGNVLQLFMYTQPWVSIYYAI